MKTRITELLGVQHPVVLAGMNYISDPKLVSTVCNAGGFGLISAQAYTGEELRAAIREIKSLTDKPFGVNVTLLHPGAAERIKVITGEKVPVVNYALGRAPDLIKTVHGYGGKILATIAIEKHALRSEQDGADVIIVTGHEAAAHGGAVTSLVLVPRIASLIKLPVIAAGGFCDGRGLAAALVLGADAISMGTRFAVTKESPMHDYYKQLIIKAGIEDTLYSDRFDGMPGRVLKTPSAEEWMKRRFSPVQAINDSLRFKRELQVSNREFLKGVLRLKKAESASIGSLARLPVGMAALRRAIQNGDTDALMMAGQDSGRIQDIPTCAELINRIVAEAGEILARSCQSAGLTPQK